MEIAPSPLRQTPRLPHKHRWRRRLSSPTGQVTLRCNAGAAPVLAVNDGGNFSGTRRMIEAAHDFVAYSIKQPTISGADYTACPALGAGTAWTSASTLNASRSFRLHQVGTVP